VLPEANAFAFSFADEMASSARLSAALKAFENVAPGTPLALGSIESVGAGPEVLVRLETEERAESTPATAVMSGIMLPSCRR
jgi:hypothetical protein